jgi:hypothetical protein
VVTEVVATPDVDDHARPVRREIDGDGSSASLERLEMRESVSLASRHCERDPLAAELEGVAREQTRSLGGARRHAATVDA